MTLEQQIFDIDDWFIYGDSWQGYPLSQMDRKRNSAINHFIDRCEIVDNLIEASSLEYCLTSPLEYVRECRKWYELNK